VAGVVACGVAAAITVPPATGADSPNHMRIVLDHSIGAVSILESRAAVERDLGHGLTVKQNAREHWAEVRYPKAALLVGYSSHTKLDPVHEQAVFVFTTSPRYRTASGAGVGSSVRTVRSIQGVTCDASSSPQACRHGMAPHKTGTDFAFRDGKVWRVTVGVSGIFG